MILFAILCGAGSVLCLMVVTGVVPMTIAILIPVGSIKCWTRKYRNKLISALVFMKSHIRWITGRYFTPYTWREGNLGPSE